METLQRLRALLEQYREQAAEAERKAAFLAGAFGMRGGPADDPCHDRFAAELKELLEDFARNDPDPGEARAMLETIFTVPETSCPKSAYWMLLAVHNLTGPAIACLRPEDARALRERYRSDYPRHRRLPAQENVLRWLKQTE